MPERAIFLDRDNTIVEDKEGYLGDPAKVKLLPGAATAIASMRRLGYRIIVASNQSGVARGMFTETDVEAVNDEIARQLRDQAGATIDASYYCPYHPDATVAAFKGEHDWRKPKPGMLMQAAEDFGLDLGLSWMIGDMPRDIAAGAAAGCRTILIRDPDHPAPENESNKLPVSPNFIVKSLADAARIVLREGRNPHPDLVPKPIEAVMPTVVADEPAVVPAVKEEEKELPVAEEMTGGTASETPTIIVQIDEQALADRLARVIVQVGGGNKPVEAIKPAMDELVVQLRQMNRQGDMPEFAMGKLVAAAAQIAVVVCVAVGVLDAVMAWNLPSGPAFNQVNTGNNIEYMVQAVRNNGEYVAQTMRAGLWMMGAVVLQGLVVGLRVGRRK